MPSTSIPFVQVATPQVAQRVAPGGAWVLHAALGLSLLIAAFGGVVLGVLAATGTGPGRDRWLASVQAHGDLQLWGWFAVFIVALTFEFIVRLNRRPAVPLRTRVLVLTLLGSGALMSAAGRIAGAQGVVVGGAGLEVAGAVLFATVVFRVPPARPWHEDLHPAFFRAGALWLVVAAVVELFAALAMQAGATPAGVLHVAAECVLRGFVLNVTVAVGLRAFPGHLGLPSVSVRSQRAIGLLLNGGLVLWVAGRVLEDGAAAAGVQAAGDLVLAAALGWMTVVFGIPGAMRAWRRVRERPQWMVPLAWAGLVIYSLGLAGGALALAAGATPQLLTAGAVRHALMLGFVGPLLLAMCHVVLERFGTGHLLWRGVLTAGFVLLIVAWPLRVLPPLVAGGEDAMARAAMGIAGILVTAALVLAAAAVLRNGLAVTTFERSFRTRR